MPEKNVADLIQNVLDKNRGFVKVKDVIQLMSLDMKRKLCPNVKRPSQSAVTRRLEEILADRFIFRKEGSTNYIFTPGLPSDIVLSFLQKGRPMSPKVLVKSLPFTKANFAAIISELEVSGKIISLYNESLEPCIVLNEQKRETERAELQSETPGKYTRERFREAFDQSDKGRSFVRIYRMRRYLNWPREVFDNMVRNLRDSEVIYVHSADPSILKGDDFNDGFLDEYGIMNGTVTWNE